MVNYHTSTLLESSEHVFELIRYNFFWGAPPYLYLYRYSDTSNVQYMYMEPGTAHQLRPARYNFGRKSEGWQRAPYI